MESARHRLISVGDSTRGPKSQTQAACVQLITKSEPCTMRPWCDSRPIQQTMNGMQYMVDGLEILNVKVREAMYPACRTITQVRATSKYNKHDYKTSTHRLHNSSFLGLPYRILNMNHKKELLWSIWVKSKSPESCSTT